MSTITESIVVLETDAVPTILKQFCQLQSTKKNSPVVSYTAAQLSEGLAKIQASDYSVVMICLSGNDGLSKVLHVLAQLQKAITADTVKIIAINRIEHPKVITTLKTRGCFDVTDDRLSVRGLQIKIQRAQELLLKSHKRRTSGEADVLNIRSGMQGQSRNESAREAQWSSAMESPADCWLIQGLNHTRFVMGQWMIGMLGPGPSEGTWEEKKNDKSRTPLWAWTPRDQKSASAFHQPDGTWYFFGKTPEFDWKSNIWRFLGKRPELYFQTTDGQKHSKIHWDAEERFYIAKNSHQAEAKRDLIIKTIEASIQIKNQHIQNRDTTSFDVELAQQRPDMHTREALGTELNYRGQKTEPQGAWNNHLNLENQGNEHKWDIGAKAFSRTEISLFLPEQNIVAELVETQGSRITLEFQSTQDFALGGVLTLTLLTKKFDQLHKERSTVQSTTLKGTVSQNFRLNPDQVQLELDFGREASSLEVLNQVQEVQRNRQESILEFFKSAR